MEKGERERTGAPKTSPVSLGAPRRGSGTTPGRTFPEVSGGGTSLLRLGPNYCLTLHRPPPVAAALSF